MIFDDFGGGFGHPFWELLDRHFDKEPIFVGVWHQGIPKYDFWMIPEANLEDFLIIVVSFFIVFGDDAMLSIALPVTCYSGFFWLWEPKLYQKGSKISPETDPRAEQS